MPDNVEIDAVAVDEEEKETCRPVAAEVAPGNDLIIERAPDDTSKPIRDCNYLCVEPDPATDDIG